MKFLDDIHAWVKEHAEQTVTHTRLNGDQWTLVPPNRTSVSYGLDPTEYPAVIVSTERVGTWNDTYTDGGPDHVTAVKCTDRELWVERRGDWTGYRLMEMPS